MGDATNKAVFLSYASQDAEGAKRICETLRAGGVEVWFDADGGLEHGDEWDAKIRRQIKECVLFIPIISANTQARHEGYFRIEWELAAQRAMGIASGVPFILPVVIDDTREPEALVPDRFRAVQWTRLRNGEMTPDVKSRFLKLWSHRVGALKHETVKAAGTDEGVSQEGRFASAPDGAKKAPLLWRRWPAGIGALVTVAVIGVAAIAWWQRSREAARAAGPGAAASTARVSPASEADQLVARAFALIEKRMNYTRADLAAADTLTRKATDLSPESGTAWAARAYVQAAHVWRSWDRSQKRLQDTEAFANQALAFDPAQTKAMLALAELHSAQRAYAQAEALARRAIVLRPEDSHLHRVLTGAIAGQGRVDEADAMSREIVRRFPRDPLVHYGLGNRQIRAGEFAAASQSFDSALALEPFTSALLNKARLLAAWKGDLAAARAVLDQIPPEDRTEIRAVGVAMWLGLLERRLDRVQAAAALTTQAYLDDAARAANGPKSTFVALALHGAGKETLAQLQWRAAESAARTRLREQPDDLLATAHLATALTWLGRTDEAAREIATLEATVREQSLGGDRAFFVARFYASLGKASKAVAYLRSAGKSLETTGNSLSLDPWWDKLRGQPEFEAFVAEAKARLAAESTPTTEPPSSIDPKSVVVLPFANLSGDKEQEYFSDGLTEEILNALQRERDLRVPGRTSSFAFKGKAMTAPEIARALGVAQVVEGSVRKAGGVVRIAVTLTRASDGFSEELGNFKEELTDIFALQDKVARVVVEKLTRRKAISGVAVLTKNPEAYDAFLRGRDLMNQTSPSWPKAVEAFRRAVELDPQFAIAWAKLGQLSAALYAYGFEGSALAESERALREALRLQADLREAHLAQAYLLRATNAEDAAVARAIERASNDRPDDPDVLLLRGEFLLSQGRDAEGIATLQRAVVVDARNGQVLNMLGNALSAAGRYDEAEAAYRQAFEVLGSSVPWTNRARIYFHGKGDVALATRTLDEVPEEIRNERYWTSRALLLYMMGEQPGALSAAARMQQRSAFFRIRPFFTAKMREAAGDADGARRDFLEALPLAERQRDEFAALPAPYAILALVYAGLSRKTEALETARKAITVDPDSAMRRAARGRTGVGALTLVDLELSSEAALAQVQARFGLIDEALAIVASHVAAGHWRRNNLLRNPDWAILRKEPRFRAIAEKAPL